MGKARGPSPTFTPRLIRVLYLVMFLVAVIIFAGILQLPNWVILVGTITIVLSYGAGLVLDIVSKDQ